MGEHYDELERRDPEQRERALLAAVRGQIDHAKANAPYFRAHLAGVDARAVSDRAALAQLPLTRKSDLVELQRRHPPFGGLAAVAVDALRRIYQSPGPINDPEGFGDDYWRFARGMYAAGIRPGDVVHNSFAYHLTPAGAMVESGAHAIGCAVIPAGVGNTEIQARIIAELRPTAYGGTPSFLKIVLEKAAELGLDASSLTKGLVGGEALPPTLRREIGNLGVAVYQGYGTADIGAIAYESPALEGMIVDEGVLLEIVEPGGRAPVGEGEVGEVVVTTLNPDYPLIRFATGDLSAVLPGPSPCGRTNMRIRGWLGRADQSAKVRGMFVHPNQVMAVAARHEEIARVRLVIADADGRDGMTLHCEAAGDDALAARIAETLQSVCKLRGEVAFADPGSLPDDGRLIEDRRDA